jgi:ribosomal protein S18 acetylase RimI-like enzyme
MGDLFAVSYAHLEPGLAFVLDDGGHAVGYIVGTSDTAAFVKRWTAEWIPLLDGKYPVPPPPPRTPEQDMIALHYGPEHMIVPALAGYPAHLHIDLLPEFQRRGYGRRLMNAFLTAVAAAGAGAVYLGMLTVNRPARAFYDRLGFTELTVPDPGPLTYLGLTLE